MILTTQTQMSINNCKENVHSYSLSTPEAKKNRNSVHGHPGENTETHPTSEKKHGNSCLFHYLSDKPKGLLLHR